MVAVGPLPSELKTEIESWRGTQALAGRAATGMGNWEAVGSPRAAVWAALSPLPSSDHSTM